LLLMMAIFGVILLWMLATWVTSWNCRKKETLGGSPLLIYLEGMGLPWSFPNTHAYPSFTHTKLKDMHTFWCIRVISVKSPCLHPDLRPPFAPYPFFQWYLQSKEIWLW
jgi:hypothetical protein